MVAPKAIHSEVLTTSIYSYRLQGFRSAAQVPTSYFERRKRVRVRVANIVAAAPPVSNDPGSAHHPADVRGEGARDGALLDPTSSGSGAMERHRGSDGETEELDTGDYYAFGVPVAVKHSFQESGVHDFTCITLNFDAIFC